MQAPTEAEAQCAELVRGGKVYATATEDMDALTFGSDVLLRHLTFSEARKIPVQQYALDKVLEGLELDMDQFVDMCILLGCDYCDSIKGVLHVHALSVSLCVSLSLFLCCLLSMLTACSAGIGRQRAYALIQQHKNIETILANLDKKKHVVPEDWPFAEARQLFLKPDVTPASECSVMPLACLLALHALHAHTRVAVQVEQARHRGARRLYVQEERLYVRPPCCDVMCPMA